MRNAGPVEAQAGIKIAGRNTKATDKQMTSPLCERNWSAPWWKWKKSLKSWLKIQHLKKKKTKTKIMASGPITSWQIDGKTMETLTDFIFMGSKILQMVTVAMKLKDACCLEEMPWPT